MVNTIVPVGVPQVGCVVELTVGVAGAEGTALMVTVEPALVEHELFVVLLTLKVLTPLDNPLKVGDAW